MICAAGLDQGVSNLWPMLYLACEKAWLGNVWPSMGNGESSCPSPLQASYCYCACAYPWCRGAEYLRVRAGGLNLEQGVEMYNTWVLPVGQKVYQSLDLAYPSRNYYSWPIPVCLDNCFCFINNTSFDAQFYTFPTNVVILYPMLALMKRFFLCACDLGCLITAKVFA